jgi:hypothetical protein
MSGTISRDNSSQISKLQWPLSVTDKKLTVASINGGKGEKENKILIFFLFFFFL